MFEIKDETIRVYTCVDGTIFHDLNLAKEHNKILMDIAKREEAMSEIDRALSSYLNHMDFSGRNRVQKQTIIRSFLEWQHGWDGITIEGVEEIVQIETPVEEEESKVILVPEGVVEIEVAEEIEDVESNNPFAGSGCTVSIDVVEEVEVDPFAIPEADANDPFNIPGVQF